MEGDEDSVEERYIQKLYPRNFHFTLELWPTKMVMRDHTGKRQAIEALFFTLPVARCPQRLVRSGPKPTAVKPRTFSNQGTRSGSTLTLFVGPGKKRSHVEQKKPPSTVARMKKPKLSNGSERAAVKSRRQSSAASYYSNRNGSVTPPLSRAETISGKLPFPQLGCTNPLFVETVDNASRGTDAKEVISLCSDSESTNTLEKFREFLYYPQIRTHPNYVVPPDVAEQVIHKIVNLNGGYHKIERRFNREKTQMREKEKQFFTIYGRTNLFFFNKILQKLGVTSCKQSPWNNSGAAVSRCKLPPSLIDLGCGLGSLVFFFALTTGCKATGIEFMDASLNAAEVINHFLQFFIQEKDISPSCNNISVIKGNLFDRKLQDTIMDHSILFMNNAHETFGARSFTIGEQTLDEYISGLFLKMRPGTRLVSFEKLIWLHSFDQEIRIEKILSDKAATSWTESSGNTVVVYIYEILRNYWKCSTCKSRNPLGNSSCRASACDGQKTQKKYTLRQIPLE